MFAYFILAGPLTVAEKTIVVAVTASKAPTAVKIVVTSFYVYCLTIFIRLDDSIHISPMSLWFN